MFVAPTPQELNEILDQFEVVELLGQGGMGAVYKARQPRLDRFVAIKLLPAFGGDDEHSFGERFEREARAMAQLNHPNVVTVHDFGETEDGHRYIVMEYVDGTDLHAAIHSGKLTTKHALAWIPQICSALEYAHNKGIVHRDIKPANILINKEGDVKVGDFGLAKLVGRKHETAITQAQVSMGTPDYAAPEALEEGAEVDRRADVYSLGVLFYELLTGKVPRGAWRPPSAFKDVDVRIDQIIVKAMQPDPNHRYQSVSQITDALNSMRNAPKLVAPKGGAAKPMLTGAVGLLNETELKQLLGADTPPKPGSKPGSAVGMSPGSGAGTGSGQMNPLVVAGVALGAVFLVVGLILLILVGSGQDDPPAPPPSKPPEIVEPAPKPEPEPKPAPKLVEVPAVPKAVPVPVPDPGSGQGKGPRPFRPDPGQGPGLDARLRTLLPNDGVIDLLKTPKIRDGAVGAWQIAENGELVFDGPSEGKERGREGWMIFPVAPGPHYSLEFEFKPGEAKPVAFQLPVGRTSVVLLLGIPGTPADSKMWAGLGAIDGAEVDSPKNPTRVELAFAPGETMKLGIRVAARGGDAVIVVSRGDEEIIRWEGKETQLAVGEEWKALEGRWIALGSQGPIVIHQASARALPPKGVLMDWARAKGSRGFGGIDEWLDAVRNVDVAAATIAGAWTLAPEGGLSVATPADPAIRPRLELPLEVRGSYEMELVFRRNSAAGDIVVLLPVDGEHVAPLHLAATGQIMGLDLNDFGVEDRTNPTSRPSPVESDRDHTLLVTMRANGPEVRIGASIDGAPVLTWWGAHSDLPLERDWPVRNKMKVTLGSLAAVHFDSILIRGVDPKSVDEPMPDSKDLEGVRLRLTELEGRFTEEIKLKAIDAFESKIALLNESYNASLKTVLALPTADAVVKDAVERELARLRAGGRVEPTDPPEMPEDVRARRARYRETVLAYEIERDRLTLPIVREHIMALDVLRAEYAQLEKPDAVAFITTTRDELDAWIQQLLESTGASTTGASADSPELTPLGAGAPATVRPKFPRARPAEKGAVIAFGRVPGADLAGMGKVPGGLSTTAVAITGLADAAIALKSNGRIEMWGAIDTFPPEIGEFRRVAQVSIGAGEDVMHVAVLTEPGEIELYTFGWADSTTTFHTQAKAIKDAVDVTAGVLGGLAIREKGEVGFWGRIDPAGTKLTDVVKIAAAPGLGVALKEDGSLAAWGQGAEALQSEIPKAKDFAFGSQPEVGAVALLPDGKVVALGSFASTQAEIDEFAAEQSIERVIAGFHAFAVQTADKKWHFFGQGIDAEYCQAQADRCWDLVIGREFIVGLRP